MSDQLTATVPASVPSTPGIEGSVPSTEAPQFYCMLTNAGAALEAQAHALGKPVRLSHVAVGDGGGTVPTPSVEAVALLGETYRKAIDSITRDEADPNIAWIQIVIPADVGGFWIREFGVYAEPLEEGGEAVLYAYGNHAPYYKLKHILGQATTHELSIPLIMSGTAEVEIVISEVGYASRLELLQLAANVRQREAETAREFIVLSDRVTRDELDRVAFENRMETELGLLKDRAAASEAAEAAQERRLARLESAVGNGDPGSSSGGTGGSTAMAVLSPAGEEIAPGVTLAAVTIVEDGGVAPKDAALTLHIEEMDV